MFISESRFLTFNLYNLFSLGFLIPCILFLPISTFFLATLSLPRVCFFSLCSKRFAPSLPQVSLSNPNFLVELAGKRSLRKLPFLPFLRSWRSVFACESFGDEPVIFSCLSKKRRGPGQETDLKRKKKGERHIRKAKFQYRQLLNLWFHVNATFMSTTL